MVQRGRRRQPQVAALASAAVALALGAACFAARRAPETRQHRVLAQLSAGPPSRAVAAPAGDSLARFFIADNLPPQWVNEHTGRPLSRDEALGEHVVLADGSSWWEGHWSRYFYSLLPTFQNSPLRVDSAEAADFVFVPVCLGNACGVRPPPDGPINGTRPEYFRERWDHWTQEGVARFLTSAHKWLPQLGRKPHLLIWNGPLTQWLWHLKQGHASNFTVMGIDMAVSRLCLHNCVASPYPSHEHPADLQPAAALTRDEIAAQRPKLATGMFVLRGTMRDAQGLTRARLHRDCTADAADCTFKAWRDELSLAERASLYDEYKTHRYCLQPVGDWVLRGAFYDCVAAGGLPVGFRKDYFQRLAYNDVIEWSRFAIAMPEAQLMASNTSVLDLIRSARSHEDTLTALQQLQPLRRVFTFALQPDASLVDFGGRYDWHPRDDAWTFSMKALLRVLCRLPEEHLRPAKCALLTARPAHPQPALLRRRPINWLTGESYDPAKQPPEAATAGNWTWDPEPLVWVPPVPPSRRRTHAHAQPQPGVGTNSWERALDAEAKQHARPKPS